MENDGEKFSVDTENLKQETKDTVNQVKETIKNVNFKNDAEETKGFVKEMMSNPFEAVKRVATGEENVLKKCIIIMIISIAASLVCAIISLVRFGRISNLFANILTLVASVLNPIAYILAPAIIILILNKNAKKSLITIISTLVITKIPTVITEVIDVFEVLIGGISLITSPISTGLAAITTILTYFGMKDLFEIEDNKDFISKYVIIRIAAAFITTILVRIGIC